MNDIEIAQANVEGCKRTSDELASELRGANQELAAAVTEHATRKTHLDAATKDYGALPDDAKAAAMHAARDAEVEAAARVAHLERERDRAKANHDEADAAQKRAVARLEVARDHAIALPANYLERTRSHYAELAHALRAAHAAAEAIEQEAVATAAATERLARRGEPIARDRNGNGVSTLGNHVVYGPLYVALGRHDLAHIELWGVRSHAVPNAGALTYPFRPGAFASVAAPPIVLDKPIAGQYRDDAADALKAALDAGDVFPPKQPPAPPRPLPNVKYKFEDLGGITYARVDDDATRAAKSKAAPDARPTRIAARSKR